MQLFNVWAELQENSIDIQTFIQIIFQRPYLIVLLQIGLIYLVGFNLLQLIRLFRNPTSSLCHQISSTFDLLISYLLRHHPVSSPGFKKRTGSVKKYLLSIAQLTIIHPHQQKTCHGWLSNPLATKKAGQPIIVSAAASPTYAWSIHLSLVSVSMAKEHPIQLQIDSNAKPRSRALSHRHLPWLPRVASCSHIDASEVNIRPLTLQTMCTSSIK